MSYTCFLSEHFFLMLPSLHALWLPVCFLDGREHESLQSDERQAGGFGIGLQQEDELPGLVHCQKSVGNVIPSEENANSHRCRVICAGETHPLCWLEGCEGRLAPLRLLSRAVGMMGTGRTGWMSTLTAGQTASQLRLKTAASHCCEQLIWALTFSSWDRSRVCLLLTACCSTWNSATQRSYSRQITAQIDCFYPAFNKPAFIFWVYVPAAL